jgi:hypothetical protein
MVDIVEKDLGPEGSVSLKFEDGKAKLALKHEHASGAVSLLVEEDAGYFLDKLAAAIPGAWDDAALAILKGLVKGL